MSKLGVRILISDGHEIVRRGIRDLLESHRTWKVCGEARSSEETLRRVKKLKPDLLVLNLNLTGMNGSQLIPRVLRVRPRLSVLVFAMYDSSATASRLLASGAQGMVLESARSDLIPAVEAVSQNKPFISRRIMEIIANGPERVPSGPIASIGLTRREVEVLELLAKGATSKDTAMELGISHKTVEAHRANIMHKLGLRSVSAMVLYAIRNNLVEPIHL